MAYASHVVAPDHCYNHGRIVQNLRSEFPRTFATRPAFHTNCCRTVTSDGISVQNQRIPYMQLGLCFTHCDADHRHNYRRLGWNRHPECLKGHAHTLVEATVIIIGWNLCTEYQKIHTCSSETRASHTRFCRGHCPSHQRIGWNIHRECPGTWALWPALHANCRRGHCHNYHRRSGWNLQDRTSVQGHGHLDPCFTQTVVETTVIIITDGADGIFKTELVSKDTGTWTRALHKLSSRPLSQLSPTERMESSRQNQCPRTRAAKPALRTD